MYISIYLSVAVFCRNISIPFSLPLSIVLSTVFSNSHSFITEANFESIILKLKFSFSSSDCICIYQYWIWAAIFLPCNSEPRLSLSTAALCSQIQLWLLWNHKWTLWPHHLPFFPPHLWMNSTHTWTSEWLAVTMLSHYWLGSALLQQLATNCFLKTEQGVHSSWQILSLWRLITSENLCYCGT